MRIALLASLLLLLCTTSCNKTPKPCIEMSLTTAATGQSVTFTSCSKKALSYQWFMSGPVGAPENSMGWSDVEFSNVFTVAGTYTITLTAYQKFSFLGKEASTQVSIVIN